ncbi:MAG TPA: YkuS family protein [Firmicutes bacterium]|nr:YkuS family protein [Bacillota bacterium]
MQKKIAIEDGLSNIRSYLEENGFKTIGLSESPQQASLFIVSGMDTNPLGDAATTSRTPVIEAAGLSAQQVLEEVEKRLQLQH